jgi:predicted Na+-dependent transporter
MPDIVKTVLNYVTSPTLTLLLKLFSTFKLIPLGWWEQSFSVDALVFVTAMIGSVIANFYPKPDWPDARKVRYYLGFLVALLVCIFFYSNISEKPPPVEHQIVYDWACFFAYFTAYLCLGFCLAHVCRFLTGK